MGEIGDEVDEIASGIAADMLSIKDRLRVETEFNGIDEWDLKEEEFERAMELGLLPLPVRLTASHIHRKTCLEKQKGC